MSHGEKCAIYTRVSTDEQGTSIVNQQEYFKDYIKRKGFEIFDIYSDGGAILRLT